MVEDINLRSNRSSRLAGTVETTNLRQGEDTKAAGRLKAFLIVAGCLLLLAVPFVFFGGLNGKKSNANQKDKVVPVTVATAKTESVPILIRSIGNVLSFSVVNVIPQVSGQITKVAFTQGDFVKVGQLLFQIDPRPYQAALDQAEGNVDRDKANFSMAQANEQKDVAQVGQAKANLEKDKASLVYASKESKRYSQLVKEGAVSNEQSDQMNTNALTADATIQADQKAIENAEAVVRADKAAIQTAKGTLEADQAAAQTARIQLGWTQIRSPLDGRTGSLAVYEGNVVTANSNTPLVSIEQVQPIYVNFTVPEQYLDEVRSNLTKKTLEVDALIEGKKKNSVNGQVSFLENTVNTTTGTVLLRAAFANKELKLFPGQFVDVVVTMPAPSPTVVVPATALQTTQQGTAAFIVKPDNTVVFSPVTVARTTGDTAALTSGVQAGDVVVTDGQLQLTPGSKVRITKESSP
jgi:membrane fusion protein, multidrug efflux system